MLRNDYETLTLDEAQVRYELDQLKKQLSKKLEERDEAHTDRIKALEKTLQEKECDWVNERNGVNKNIPGFLIVLILISFFYKRQ